MNGKKDMGYFKTDPAARRAYRARWGQVWRRMLATGAASPEEEEETRRSVLREAAGVESSSLLSRAGYEATMLHLGAMLGGEGGERTLRRPWRARRIAKIERIAAELRPEDAESYIGGVLDDMGVIGDPRKWRTGLIDEDLQKLMLTMVSQQRRRRAKE